ncbi:MAG: DUF2164 domain-containing protein [Calditrichaeota bacterium]|nr:MAG: DUF2164 domain-containing protein [Calditrichota bacterium]
MIEISKENKEEIVSKLKSHFLQELDYDIGQFDAEFLLEFFIKEIGPYFYNQALTDVHGLLEQKMESMMETLYDLEKPITNKK